MSKTNLCVRTPPSRRCVLTEANRTQRCDTLMMMTTTMMMMMMEYYYVMLHVSIAQIWRCCEYYYYYCYYCYSASFASLPLSLSFARVIFPHQAIHAIVYVHFAHGFRVCFSSTSASLRKRYTSLSFRSRRHRRSVLSFCNTSRASRIRTRPPSFLSTAVWSNVVGSSGDPSVFSVDARTYVNFVPTSIGYTSTFTSTVTSASPYGSIGRRIARPGRTSSHPDRRRSFRTSLRILTNRIQYYSDPPPPPAVFLFFLLALMLLFLRRAHDVDAALSSSL